MALQTKYDLVDLIIRTLKEHEKALDDIASRLEEVTLFQEMQVKKSF